MTSPLERVAVALDTPDRETFRRWCRTFGPRVGALKVGLEAFCRWGPGAVEEARDHGAVFLDLKLHDIPKTVAGAVAACRDLGVELLTVHGGGGATMLEAAREAAGDRLRLLAVTLLTHLDRDALAALDLGGDDEARAARAERWARIARQAGCAGAVCSPLEAARLRAALPRPFLLVTPGIRPAGGAGAAGMAAVAADDQQRTASPARALAAGADLLVVGRPLTAAPDPAAALDALERELA